MTSAAARLSPQTCFRLPHCFGRIRGLQLSRPPALRRADYRLPPVIVLPLMMLLILMVGIVSVDEINRSASSGVGVLLLVVLVYMEI